MPVNLSIKNAPDQVVQRLRERAERHHRLLQGELLAILEEAVEEERPATPAEDRLELIKGLNHAGGEAGPVKLTDRGCQTWQVQR